MPAPVPPIPSDPGLPGARGLLTGEGHSALEAFLGERGWTLQEARPVQAMYRPGRSCVVRYRALADGSRGRRSFVLCAETRANERPPVPVPPGFEERAGLADPVAPAGPYLAWAFPYDPSLPDLPRASWGPAVRDRLGADAVSVQALRYRPRRRAVFRYRALRRVRGERRWETGFGKVLPGSKADRARAAAEVLAGGSTGIRLSLPAGSLGEHTFLFEPAAGRSLRELLVTGAALPAPARVAALPEALAARAGHTGPEVGAGRPDPVESARSGVSMIEVLAPGAADDARRVLDAVAEGRLRDPMPARVVHGDLYEAQVFVDRDYSLGLIDLDDLGPGDPASDAANFCAHLLALALSVPAAAGRLSAYRTLVRRAFLDRLDVAPVALAWREALAMLLLATGPFRVLDPRWPAEVGRRVRLAVRLLDDV
jgi:hypothetical protein